MACLKAVFAGVLHPPAMVRTEHTHARTHTHSFSHTLQWRLITVCKRVSERERAHEYLCRHRLVRPLVGFSHLKL